MAFRASPSPFGMPPGASNNIQTQTGPNLEEIQTEAVGFQAIARGARLRLLPSPWPNDSLPPPTASLLSIASKKGLLAAAGPESVIVAATDSVRQAISAPADGKIKPFTPQLTLPLGMRISQVAFSADENFLVLSAENGGGLAVYDVQSVMQGNTQTAFEMATSGTALRALIPNPVPEKAELFAAVSVNGELMIADLKKQQFLTGTQGQVLKSGVSCVSWSKGGKQLVAGLADGTSHQMNPEGEGKGDIPKPSGLEGDQFVSSISWLENDVFLVAHTPSSSDEGPAPITTYHLITRNLRQAPPSIGYQKLPDPVAPFLPDRSPPFQFMQRLRNFPPNLDDAIIVASTASPDIGLITKSKIPLSDDAISNVFTTTMIANDSRRAAMPLSNGSVETSPIGVGLDLSSREPVERPLPAEEYNASQSPLPALMVLSNEGDLCAWWFVYAESIRQGTTFSGLVVAGGPHVQQQPQTERQISPFANANSQTAPVIGQNTFGKPSTPSASPFGGASNSSAPQPFGSTNASGPAFGAPSAFGKPASPWGGPNSTPSTSQSGISTFGQPGLGSSTPMGPTTQGTAFGMAGGMGNRGSPWGAPSAGTAAATGSVFGQSGFSGKKPPLTGAFGTSAGNSGISAGPFGAFASKPSAFMTAAPSSDAGSLFGKPTSTASFGSGMDTDTSFGSTPKKDAEAPQNTFGTENFNLGSTFKGDGFSANDVPIPTGNGAGSMFGSGFGDALGAAQKETSTPQIKDPDTGEEPNKPAPPQLQFPTVSVPPKTSGLFGTQSQSKTTPAAVGSSQPTGFTIETFGNSNTISTTPKDTPKKADQPRPSVETSPKIKQEPQSDLGETSRLNKNDIRPHGFVEPETPPASKSSDAPLPPESTSKSSFAPGDSSNSSKSSDDAPLPPDFLPSKTKLKEVEAAPAEEAALPSDEDREEDFEEGTEEGSYTDEEERTDDEEEVLDDEGEVLDDEGSGVDVAQEISPTTDPNQSPKITPESSFGASLDKSPPGTGGLFGRVTSPSDRQKGKPPLFGEVGKTSAPYLPPPTKSQQSPRSPSPVRSNTLGDSLRPDNARSISAPGPFQALNNRKAALSKTAVTLKPQLSPKEIRRLARKQMAKEQAKIAQDEEQDLSDREDERVREELATEVEGTLTLDPFLAHQDYVGDGVKPGIPGQIEKVYRDINSMIDTLGLNARALKAFMKGHENMHKKDGARTRNDLEKDDDWCLIEIGDLPCIEEALSNKLASGQTKDLPEKLDKCRNLRKEVTALRAKCSDIARAIEAQADGNEVELSAPLSLDQATLQHDLRKKMTRFQNLLAEAEENITMLRAKLASYGTGEGKGPPLKKPTVEAVTNTIMKMTSIVEKKSLDIDILENRMRGLRFSSAAGQSSREGSPVNPASSSRRRPMSGFAASAMQNGHSHTPGRSSLLGRSTTNGDGAHRKGLMTEITPEEVQRYREKARRRQEVNAIMRAAFEKNGPRITVLE